MRETKTKIRRELIVEGMEKWRSNTTGDKLKRKLISCLRQKPILDLCNYVREFGWLAIKGDK